MKHFIIASALLIAAQAGRTQTLKTYSGLYEEGKVTYTYYEDADGERVKHGKYVYNRRDNLGLSYSVSGNYKNNVKDGKWTYKDDIATGLGKHGRSMTVINYVDGNMEGTISRTDTYNDGTTTTTRYQMKGNRVTGAVKEKVEATLLYPNAYTLAGQFDDDGFPDGVWTKKYEKDGNLFTDTEKYVHGLLVARQTKNESTGKIVRSPFYIDPQKFVAAYSPDKDSIVVDGFVCKQEMRFAEGEQNYRRSKKPFFYSGRMGKYYAFASEEEKDWQRLPDIIGANIRGFAFGAKIEKGYGTEQNPYQGIPYKEIAIVDEIEKETDESPTEGEVYTIVEQAPRFPGGQEAWLRYLAANIKYPVDAQGRRIQGRVTVQFVVNKDGSISDAMIVRSIDPACDEEALRLINAMPRWEPARSGGKSVRARCVQQVVFSSK